MSSDRGNGAFLVAGIVLFLLAQGYFGWVAVSQHRSHETYYHDVGIIDDSLSNTLRGEFMVSPLIGKSHFAVHFTPALLLLLPFYALFDHPLTLMLAQSVLLVGGAVPLYLLARHLTGRESLAVLTGLLYLVNYFVATIHLAAHYEAMLPLFLFAALACAVSGRRRLYWPFLLLAMAVKTDVALYTFFLGIYLLLVRRDKALGWGTMAASAAWFAIAVAGVALFSKGEGRPEYLRFWGVYGSTPREIALYLIAHPWVPLRSLLSWNFLLLIATVGFLSLADWRAFLLALPPAMVLLLSPTIDFQYFLYYRSATILPFLFFAAALGLRRFQALPRGREAIPIAILLLAILGNVACLAARPTRTNRQHFRPFEVTSHHRAFLPLFKAHVPPGTIVAAQWDLYTQVPRSVTKRPLEDYRDADWIAIDTRGSPGPMPRGFAVEISRYIQLHADIVAQRDGYLLARRRGPSTHSPP